MRRGLCYQMSALYHCRREPDNHDDGRDPPTVIQTWGSSALFSYRQANQPPGAGFLPTSLRFLYTENPTLGVGFSEA